MGKHQGENTKGLDFIGKAYKQKGVVNFCPNCKTVLSNEDSQGGICDRCNGRGELPQYKYYMNGICFKCHGAGVVFKDDL